MIKGSKICGVSDLDTLNYILNHPYPPQFIGFICNYKKSPRYVGIKRLKELLSTNKKNCKFVSVLVKPNEEILDAIKDFSFDYYQFTTVRLMRLNLLKKDIIKRLFLF